MGSVTPKKQAWQCSDGAALHHFARLTRKAQPRRLPQQREGERLLAGRHPHRLLRAAVHRRSGLALRGLCAARSAAVTSRDEGLQAGAVNEGPPDGLRLDVGPVEALLQGVEVDDGDLVDVGDGEGCDEVEVGVLEVHAADFRAPRIQKELLPLCSSQGKRSLSPPQGTATSRPAQLRPPPRRAKTHPCAVQHLRNSLPSEAATGHRAGQDATTANSLCPWERPRDNDHSHHLKNAPQVSHPERAVSFIHPNSHEQLEQRRCHGKRKTLSL